MSYAERHQIDVVTDADGDVTAYSPTVTGRIVSVTYTKIDFADTVDFTITAEATGQSIWTDTNITATETVVPLQTGSLPTGAASALTEVPIYLAHDRVKFVIASGGDTKSGTFHVVVA